MFSSNKKDPNSFVHALVVASQKVVDLIGRDLQEYFMKYRVSLLGVIPSETYGPDAITFVLAGKQADIKNCLTNLKQICYEKEFGIECRPIGSLPPALKGYLTDMEDDLKFEKVFSYCSKEYLEYCQKHNIKPHPEVVDGLEFNSSL